MLTKAGIKTVVQGTKTVKREKKKNTEFLKSKYSIFRKSPNKCMFPKLSAL